MDPITLSVLASGAMSLLGSGTSMLTSFMGNSASKSAARDSFNYQRKLMREQQAWQEYMSNTAHQREVKDLRAAGLNPILSATGGNGASSPVVSAPSVNMANVGFHDNNSAFSAADSVSKLKKAFDTEIEQLKLNADKTSADIQSQKKITTATVDKINAEIRNLDADTYRKTHRVALPLGSEIPACLSDSLKQLPRASLDWYLENIGRPFSNFVENSAKSVVPVLKSRSVPSRGRDHWKKDQSDFPIKVKIHGDPFYKGWKR